VYEAAEQAMSAADWPQQVLRQSNLEAVFLTNDFDDPLEGFDTSIYIPCLRTDDLVFHLAKDAVRDRLERATGASVSNAGQLREAIRALFVHFRRNNAKACAISLPPDFTPVRVSDTRASAAIESIWRDGAEAGEVHRRAASHWVFWTLAELCDEFRLPFDLMIGVHRNVYPGGVNQGMDLYDNRVSLIQYRELFNAFPRVVFPVSVLASVTNQELTSYAWIFPNVVTNGHWWYSNTPAFIEHDAAARLEAVPRTKQIAYYSDMYKLEFALPKFNMYRRILAKILAKRFVQDRGWSEERAVDLGRQVLRTNVEEIFRIREPAPTLADEPPSTVRSVTWAGAATAASHTAWNEPAVAGEFTYWPKTTTEDEAEEYGLAEETETPAPPNSPPIDQETAPIGEESEEIDLVEDFDTPQDDLLPAEEPLSLEFEEEKDRE
jgi:hypothetical protein